MPKDSKKLKELIEKVNKISLKEKKPRPVSINLKKIIEDYKNQRLEKLEQQMSDLNVKRKSSKKRKSNKKRNSFGKKRKVKGLTKNMYTIKTSTIPNAGNGAFANIFLPKGTVLGNYKGKKLTAKQYNRLSENEQEYIWELSSKNGPIYIDGKPIKTSNWLRYLNDSRDKRQNVEPYQYGQKLYYRTIKNIKPGQELFITYGDDYW